MSCSSQERIQSDGRTLEALSSTAWQLRLTCFLRRANMAYVRQSGPGQILALAFRSKPLNPFDAFSLRWDGLASGLNPHAFPGKRIKALAHNSFMGQVKTSQGDDPAPNIPPTTYTEPWPQVRPIFSLSTLSTGPESALGP